MMTRPLGPSFWVIHLQPCIIIRLISPELAYEVDIQGSCLPRIMWIEASRMHGQLMSMHRKLVDSSWSMIACNHPSV